MNFTKYSATIAAAGLLLAATSARALTFGQIDNFEDGTTENWRNGGAGNAPPVLNIPTGGPGGMDDNFMEISADGEDAGGFLTVFNRAQWLGDYIGTGVDAVEMDLENLGAVDLNIRLAFKTNPGPSSSGYLTEPFSLPAGGGWQHAIFLITPSTVTGVSGPADFNTFFANGMGEVRIINETDPNNLNGEPVVSTLGIDNIHAVPEPGSTALAVLGLTGLGLFLRQKHRVAA